MCSGACFPVLVSKLIQSYSDNVQPSGSSCVRGRVKFKVKRTTAQHPPTPWWWGPEMQQHPQGLACHKFNSGVEHRWPQRYPKAECPERPLKLLGSTGLFQPSQNLCWTRGYQNHDMHSVSSWSQWPAPFSKALLQEGNGASESCHSNVGICQDWHEGTDWRHISKFRIVLNHATCEMCSVDASDVFPWVYQWADEHFNFNWFLHIFQSWLWSVSSSRWCSMSWTRRQAAPCSSLQV